MIEGESKFKPREKKYFKGDRVVHRVRCGLEIKRNENGTVAIDLAKSVSLATLIRKVAAM